MTLVVVGAVSFGLYQGVHSLLAEAARGQDPHKLVDPNDVIKTTVTVLTLMGAVLAGIYAYRKQLLNEGDAHRADASQLADRYTVAAEQLGHDQAAVRLAGVYALARLADDWEEQRQVCVDVLCAYLRMPYALDSNADNYKAGEREVRLTIIRVIRDHLRQPGANTSWCDCSLDFTGATFDGGDFSGSHFLDVVTFDRATFSRGTVTFNQAQFKNSAASFRHAIFKGGTVEFYGTEFHVSTTLFDHATFSGSSVQLFSANFGDGTVSFYDARFLDGKVEFDHARFGNGIVTFNRSHFISSTISFDRAQFNGSTVTFGETGFHGGTTTFNYTNFEGCTVRFEETRFRGGTISFTDATHNGSTIVHSGEILDRAVIDWGSFPRPAGA